MLRIGNSLCWPSGKPTEEATIFWIKLSHGKIRFKLLYRHMEFDSGFGLHLRTHRVYTGKTFVSMTKICNFQLLDL